MRKLNTFSITARCEKKGQFGVAVSTRVPAVGSICPFVKAGVGAIATQSFVNPYIGINGLKYLEEGGKCHGSQRDAGRKHASAAPGKAAGH
ncbi:putative Ntn-hydrolase superfamily protein [Geomicrobium halophilum]|uniref:Putative Ntn-hydrolase superfamily protein n=1 Tax=Geomicrobium halophilum TaxID=549000 RepID=A0A841PYU0_9BACL|nr:DUF1028 domain-containing protein [Geomicrobium halophilum]MBB6449903.1 putative Ntn-hydrolase superfamily protein [Geomicrobium halophilum]